MRGGVSVNDMLYLYSYEDRNAMYEIVNENVEATKASGLPLI
jgi:hypothetical protein